MTCPNPCLRSPARPQAQERGAAIFVVVLVIALLSGIGAFAAHSASLVDTATGYVRQMSQAQGLSIYAGLLAASELDEGRASAILDQMAERAEVCPSNPAGASLPCYKIMDDEMTARVRSHPSNNVTLIDLQTATAAGSLGPAHGLTSTTAGLEGALMVEFLEAYQAIPPAGEDKGGQGRYKTYEITVNAWSQVRPALGVNSTSWCPGVGETTSISSNVADAMSASATLQAVRAYVHVPGIP